MDSAPGIISVMEQVVAEYDLGEEILSEWRQLIGVPLPKQMEIIFPNKGEEFHDRIANRYRSIYDTKAIEICPPFPGLWNMLERLQEARVHIAIASSKRRHLIETVLEHHQIENYFCLLVGAQDVSNHKPHPESVHHITNKLDVPYSDVVVVGDSTFDLEMARNAGVDGIGVTTGIHTKELLQLAEPLHVVDGLEAVLPLILNGRMK